MIRDCFRLQELQACREVCLGLSRFSDGLSCLFWPGSPGRNALPGTEPPSVSTNLVSASRNTLLGLSRPVSSYRCVSLGL